MSEPTREMRDKALLLAREIITQAERTDCPLKFTRGQYLGGNIAGIDTSRGDLQGVADAVQERCEGCFLGNAFLTFARVFDNVPACSVNGHGGYARLAREQAANVLSGVFDPETIDCLECAFERGHPDNIPDTDRTRGAATFGFKFDGPRSAALGIARNVIENHGLFIVDPVSDDDYDWKSDRFDLGDDWDDDDDSDEDLDDDEEDS